MPGPVENRHAKPKRNPIARGIGCLALIIVVAGFLLIGVVGNVLAWAWSVLAQPRLPDSFLLVALVAIIVLGPLSIARKSRRAREDRARLVQEFPPATFGDYQPNGHDGLGK